MKYFNLFDDGQIPAIGLGTWKSDQQPLHQAVQEAIKIGYRHIDCAAIYLNEAVVGDALHHAFEKNIVDRDNLWITSKLWNSYHRPEDVLPACKATLKELRLDYLDLYLIHWPISVAPHVGVAFPNVDIADDFLTLEDAPIEDTWQAMEELVSSGLVRYIGVSNFSQTKLRKLLATTKVQPAVNQIENHPFLAQFDLVDYCEKHKILVTAYSPLGSADRSSQLKKKQEPSLLSDTTILSIAGTHNKSTAQILLAWLLQRGVAAIPKSVNKDRIAENLAAINVKLSLNEMSTINKLDKNYRYLDGSFWAGKGSPYTVANIFD